MPDGGRVAFFAIDTSPMLKGYYEDGAVKVKVAPQKDNVPVQLAWLDSALAASRADWNIVIGHHPIYTGNGPVRPLAQAPDQETFITAEIPSMLPSLTLAFTSWMTSDPSSPDPAASTATCGDRM